MTIPKSSPKRLDPSTAAEMLSIPHDASPSVIDQATDRTVELISVEGRKSQQHHVRDARRTLTDPEWAARERVTLGYAGFAALLLTEVAAFVCAFQLITGWDAFLSIIPEDVTLPENMVFAPLILNILWFAAIIWRPLSPLGGRNQARKLFWSALGLALVANLVVATSVVFSDVDTPYAFSPFITIVIALVLCTALDLLAKNGEEKGLSQ
ncbi:hypothetical protein [Auritidibacter ignavus]|uniref:hypothetical protein n=1 Tax=Auritidibacter ignavus TaxID=678932 RepID=UPI0024BAD39E|nr:hypothetical protein [Auritidibacter ignavus]WHS27859.1 hypothetical protein QM395_10925 [Auritidibacter ignavus]